MALSYRGARILTARFGCRIFPYELQYITSLCEKENCMRRWILVRTTSVGLVLLLVVAGVIGCFEGGKEKSKGANQDTSSALSVAEKAETSSDKADPSLPK